MSRVGTDAGANAAPTPDADPTAVPTVAAVQAAALDAADPLSRYRARFIQPHGPEGPGGPAIYLAGQSLGLQATTVRAAFDAQLDAWAHLGVEGHFAPGNPWFTYDETFRAPMARIVGAAPSEVAILNTLTVNLHLMLASFFRPDGQRRRILTDAPLFPSDRHALTSHLAWRGLDPERDLVIVGPRTGEDTVRVEDVEAALHEHGSTIALALFDGVNFATGQALPIARLTAAAHEAGALVGWELAHGAGNLVLDLHDDDVDFAVWCTYKYLNGGPGSVGAIFVHERHAADPDIPRLDGWWGATPEHRFDPTGPFVADTGAAAWKMSTSPLFNMVALAASLAIFDEVGMPALRERSIRLTGYLAGLLADLGVELLTPTDAASRGAQLSLRFADAPAVLESLARQGVIADYRAPDVIRVAPTPLYNTFAECQRLAVILAEIEGGTLDEVTSAAAFEPDELLDALVATVPEAADRRDAIRVVRAPGRVNLIGEYTDINLGFVLPAAIDLEIRIAYLPTDDGRVELTRLDDGDADGFDLAADRPRAGTWLDYVAGTAWALQDAGLPRRGLRGVIASTLPSNAGLSSSAAIELASAWAMLDDAAETVDPMRLARICQRAENAYVGVQSGLMDQFAEACGVAGSAVLLDCRSLDWRPVAIPADVALVVLHTGARRHLDGSEYNTRRRQCEAAVAAIAATHPDVHSLRDVSLELLEASCSAIDPTDYLRARHVVTEQFRVTETVAALEAGDLGAVGTAFAQSHASLRDQFGVVSPELDTMVEIATAVPGVVAARMTGAGFGGCTVNLVRPDAVEGLRTAVLDRYPARTGLTPLILPVQAAAGASRLR